MTLLRPTGVPSAGARASVTADSAQPTTKRENRSTIAARYNFERQRLRHAPQQWRLPWFRKLVCDSFGATETRAELHRLLARDRAVLVCGGERGRRSELVLGSVGAAVFLSIAESTSANEILERTARALGRPGSPPALPASILLWDGAESAAPNAIATALAVLLRSSPAGKVVILSSGTIPELELPTLDLGS